MLPFLVERVLGPRRESAGRARARNRATPCARTPPSSSTQSDAGSHPARHRDGGRHAFALDWPLGEARPGTVDEYTDAWFVGFDPDITLGRLGWLRRESGPWATREQASAVALPIWIDFMEAYVARAAKRVPPS